MTNHEAKTITNHEAKTITNHEAIEVLKSILMANPQYYSNNRINEAVCKACAALEPDEEVNEFACPFCGDVTYTATDYIPRFCQECGRDMGFREETENDNK